jgi:hypothetical protein|tara:strand:- start:213 stop:656 length:444 start_codon:yes stop_codon:yes gene_type:complete
MASTKKAKTLFQHLSGLKESKTPWDSLSVMDKKTFEPFMVNRFLSMNMGLLELVNELQKFTIGQLSPRDVYKMYLDFLPKRRSFDKYIKGKKDDKYNSNVLEYLAKYYQVSQREVRDYLEILSKDDITEILLKYGLDKKEIKKWLKQ